LVVEPGVPTPRSEPVELRTERPADVTWKRLQEQIDWFDRKSGSAQRRFKQLKVATLTLAAGLPVVVAASAPTWVAALMGALIAVIEGAQQLFNFQENWINYRSACESLIREQYLYLARSGRYADVADADVVLAEAVERIVSHENSHWAERETT
jgi:hypothetical protein